METITSGTQHHLKSNDVRLNLASAGTRHS